MTGGTPPAFEETSIDPVRMAIGRGQITNFKGHSLKKSKFV